MRFDGDDSRPLFWRNVRVYQRVRFGQRWMIAMAKRGPLVAVVTSPVSGAPPEELNGEAWFSADLYEMDGQVIRKNVLVPNAAVFITEDGYRAAIQKGVEQRSLAAVLNRLCDKPAVSCVEQDAPPKASSSPVTGEPSAVDPSPSPEPVQIPSAPVQNRHQARVVEAAHPMTACLILTRPEGNQGRAPCNCRRWTEFVPWPDLVAQRSEHLADWQVDPPIGRAFRMPDLPDAQRQVIAVTKAAVHATVDGSTGLDPGAERRWVLCDIFVTGSATRWPVVIDGQQTALSVQLPGRVDQVLVPCVLLAEPVEVTFQ